MTVEAKLREDARHIFAEALRAADPSEAIRRYLRLNGNVLEAGEKSYPLNGARIFVVGAGKASAGMALAVEELLGDRIATGLISVKYGHTETLRRIELNECGHPYPDERGVQGAKEIAGLLDTVCEKDVVLCLISGGASALLPAPADGISLEAKQACTKLLLASGASIHEINAVRKHLSTLKGGQLAVQAMPAHVVSLILSDVIGNDLDVIGSGITAPDRSTFGSAIAALSKYQILEQVDSAVRQRLEAGAKGQIKETPKQDHPVFHRTQNLLVGSTDQALESAEREARARGYHTMILSSSIEGETREVARVHAAIAREIITHQRPLNRPACVISGGETTVTLKGSGKGGRNQEFVLAGAIDIQGLPGVVLFSAGTDGTDGPTDAAGAIADGLTVDRSERLGLNAQEYLSRNDSYSYFDPLGDLVKTGPTKTNVMDVRLALVG